MLHRLLTVLLLVSLSGCAQYWARPGGTPAQLAYAKQSCEARAFQGFPPALQQVMTSPGYFSPQQTNCHTENGRTHCYTTGGFWVPPNFAIVDHNEQGRDAAYRGCMYADGWVLANDEKDAIAITNSRPVPPLLSGPPPPAGPRKN